MKKYNQWNYWLNIGISLDKLGNSISSGSHNNTISGRTGANANEKGPNQTFWKLQEAIINFAFLPVDGPDHCLQAYDKEFDSTTFREGNKFVRSILAFIILPSCLIIGIVLRIAKPIRNIFRKRKSIKKQLY